MKRKRVDVNLKELDQIIDHAREVPLSESESETLKEALHAQAGMLPQQRSTEKISAVLPPADPPHQLSPFEQSQEKSKGHGRTGAFPTPVRRPLPLLILRSTRAIPARAAKRAKSIHRKNPGRW
jgi:hypothetical protein